MRVVALVVLLLGGALFEQWVDLAAQNHPWRVAIVGTIVLVLGGAVLFLFPSGPLIAIGAVLAGAWAIGIVAALDARDHELGYYCKYDAKSQAELDECMSSVTTDDIEKLDTPAARFARGETLECRRGSGPYCADAAEDAEIEYAQ